MERACEVAEWVHFGHAVPIEILYLSSTRLPAGRKLVNTY